MNNIGELDEILIYSGSFLSLSLKILPEFDLLNSIFAGILMHYSEFIS